jgi:hypothetical protein
MKPSFLQHVRIAVGHWLLRFINAAGTTTRVSPRLVTNNAAFLKRAAEGAARTARLMGLD